MRARGSNPGGFDPGGYEFDLSRGELYGRILAYGRPVNDQPAKPVLHVVQTVRQPPEPDDWHRVQVDLRGTSLKAYVEGLLVADVTTDGEPGAVVLRAQMSDIEFRNVAIVPLSF